ncbi:hypothetical protein LLG95_05600 [bacterium]|nr:hypothetical protein [bacterium]
MRQSISESHRISPRFLTGTSVYSFFGNRHWNRRGLAARCQADHRIGGRGLPWGGARRPKIHQHGAAQTVEIGGYAHRVLTVENDSTSFPITQNAINRPQNTISMEIKTDRGNSGKTLCPIQKYSSHSYHEFGSAALGTAQFTFAFLTFSCIYTANYNIVFNGVMSIPPNTTTKQLKKVCEFFLECANWIKI